MKKIIVFAICAVCLLFCGCSGYKEIERGYFVTSIGVAKKSESYTLFVETLVYENDMQGKKIMSSDGENIEKAFEQLKKQLVKNLYFEHCGIIALQSDLNDELSEILDFFKKSNFFNADVYIVTTDDTALLFNGVNSNQAIGYGVISLIKNADEKDFCSQIYMLERRLTYKESFKLPKVNIENNVLVLE